VRASLLVARGALSVALLAGTGFFVRSLQRIMRQDLGLDLAHVIIADFPRHETGYSRETERSIYERMRAGARTVPGVEGASFTIGVPLEGQYALSLRLPGHDSIPGMPRGHAPFLYAVTPDFFGTMGTRLLAGRAFTESDVAGPAVAVVNESMARTLWSGADPIGRCFKIELASPTPDCIQVRMLFQTSARDPAVLGGCVAVVLASGWSRPSYRRGGPPAWIPPSPSRHNSPRRGGRDC
jgi:hypothetical protein